MLTEIEPEKMLKQVPQFKEKGQAVSRGIHDWVLRGGKPRRAIADLLHGTWLGHPLHPVLTDFTIGAWLFSYVLDLMGMVRRSKGIEQASDVLLNIGNASAVATAAAGIADYSTIPRKSMATGALHGTLNILGFVVNVLSAILRRRGNRNAGFVLSSISSSILFLSAWLGGEMVYKYEVGTNKTPKPPEEKKWHPTIGEQDLGEGMARRVEVDGSPVMLYRYQSQIYAIGAVCGHEGGPLEEGDFDGFCVTCPWHQSVYDVRNGSVIHGPTTYAEPAFDVRIMHGVIEVRRREKQPTAETEQAFDHVMA